MKLRIILTTLFFLIINFCNGQIANSDFEEWEMPGNTERLIDWECNGDFLGACRKDSIGINNFAVRMDNSLPCVDSVDPSIGLRRGRGDLSQTFNAPSHEFTLSYDLIIDSIDQPAVFRIALSKSGISGFYSAEYTELFNGTVTSHLSIPADLDLNNIRIDIRPKGILKENAQHSCDLGYISGIIDNIQIEETVSTKVISEGQVVLYPNPTDGVINIHSLDRAIDRVEVFDLLGRKLIVQPIDQSDTVQLDLASMGEMLFVRVIDQDGNSWVQKVIVD